MKQISTLFFLFIFGVSGFAQTENFINNNGDVICFTTFGTGFPILIINGGPGMSSEGFMPLAKTLSENNKTIIYDQRGTGKSTLKAVNETTITLDLMVEDIEVLRTHLKIDSWIVLGHSFGGMLASYYTTKHSKNVKGLILSSSGGVDLSLLSRINITGQLTQKQQDSLSYWNQKIANGDTSHFARLQRGKYLASAYLYKKDFVDVVAERLTQGNSQINSLVWQNMHTIAFDCKKQLQQYTKPVLIIQGKQDIVNKDIAVKTHALFQDSKLVYIDECAHYGWLEQPEQYFKEINTFLARAAS